MLRVQRVLVDLCIFPSNWRIWVYSNKYFLCIFHFTTWEFYVLNTSFAAHDPLCATTLVLNMHWPKLGTRLTGATDLRCACECRCVRVDVSACVRARACVRLWVCACSREEEGMVNETMRHQYQQTADWHVVCNAHAPRTFACSHVLCMCEWKRNVRRDSDLCLVLVCGKFVFLRCYQQNQKKWHYFPFLIAVG